MTAINYIGYIQNFKEIIMKVSKMLMIGLMCSVGSVALATNPPTNTDNSIKNSATASAAAAAASNATAVGYGGHASATGGAVVGSGNSASNSSVRDSGNFNGTVTGGTGGSATVERGAVQNDVNNSNVNLNRTGDSTSSSNQQQQQQQSTSSSADNSGNNVGSGNETDVEVNVGGDTHITRQRRIPVSSSFAPALTSGLDTCVSSVSGGVSTQILGISFGKTTIDEGCQLRKETNLLRSFETTEFQRAACFRMSQDRPGAQIKKALESAGIDCSNIEVAVPVVTTPVVETDPVTKEYVQESVDRAFKRSMSK